MYPASEKVVGPSTRIYTPTALCGSPPASQPRRSAIFIAEHPAFEPLILLTITLNCVMMAWDSALDPPGTTKARLIGVSELACLCLFSVEALVKLTAYGAVEYANDGWCQLDAAVVTLGWVEILIPSFSSFTVIRALRGLRPLRALQLLTGMKVLVQSILHSLPRVGLLCMRLVMRPRTRGHAPPRVAPHAPHAHGTHRSAPSLVSVPSSSSSRH